MDCCYSICLYQVFSILNHCLRYIAASFLTALITWKLLHFAYHCCMHFFPPHSTNCWYSKGVNLCDHEYSLLFWFGCLLHCIRCAWVKDKENYYLITTSWLHQSPRLLCKLDRSQGWNKKTKRLGGRVVVMVNSAQVFDTVPHTMIYKLP